MRKIGTIVAAILLLTSGRRTTTEFPPNESGTEIKPIVELSLPLVWGHVDNNQGYYVYCFTVDGELLEKQYVVQNKIIVDGLEQNHSYIFYVTTITDFNIESRPSDIFIYTMGTHIPKILRYFIYENNDVEFYIDASLNKNVEFYASSDLRSWEYLGIFENVSNHFIVHDNLANQGMRFYQFEIK